jgi:hypothetical protein
MFRHRASAISIRCCGGSELRPCVAAQGRACAGTLRDEPNRIAQPEMPRRLVDAGDEGVRDASAPFSAESEKKARIGAEASRTRSFSTTHLSRKPLRPPDGGRRSFGHGARRRGFFPMPLTRHGRVARASYAPPPARGNLSRFGRRSQRAAVDISCDRDDRERLVAFRPNPYAANPHGSFDIGRRLGLSLPRFGAAVSPRFSFVVAYALG